MRFQKNRLGALLLLAAGCSLAVGCAPLTGAVRETPGRTTSAGATPTCIWGWGPYIGKEFPDRTSAWKQALASTGLDARDAKVEGVGETSVRIYDGKRTESWGMAYQEIKATVIVEDAQDPDTLGNAMVQVYRAVRSLGPTEKDATHTRLSILFVSSKDKNDAVARTCDHMQGIKLIEEGKGGRELFEATCRQ